MTNIMHRRITVNLDYQTTLNSLPAWSAASVSGTGIDLDFIEDAYTEEAIKSWTGQLGALDRPASKVSSFAPTMYHRALGATDPVVARELDVAGVITDLGDRVGVPVGVILSAAKINRRTYQWWSANPGTSPRLASQGRLWEVVQTVEDLEALVDSPATWLRTGNHLELLKKGKLASLVDAAVAVRRPERISMPVGPIYSGEHEHETKTSDAPRSAQTAVRAVRSD